MREISYTNELGQTLELDESPDYALIHITGTNPPNASISTSRIVNFDGSNYVGSVLNSRNIVLALLIKGDIETNRLRLYDIFKVKRKGTLNYQGASDELRIEAYTESIEVNPMSKPIIAMISLICPKPYFEAIHSTTQNITSVVPRLKFPLENNSSGVELGILQTNKAVNIINTGDTQIGMMIRFRAIGAVNKPKLINTQTLESIELDTAMQAGDMISVSTEIGQKRIELDRNSVVSNIFNTLVPGSKFLNLYEGDNILYGTAQSGFESLLIEVEYRTKVIGV